MTEKQPWHGVVVATSVPMNSDCEVNLDAYRKKVAWLAEKGCDGVTPNGSLGEYHTLTFAERDALVEAAVEAAPEGFSVVPGVGAYGSAEAKRHTQQAKDAGAGAVMSLPPNGFPADERAILAHYEAVASVGIPVVAYNNPITTKIDMKPALLAKLHEEGLIVAIKENSNDVRRCWEISELAPELDILIGADDLLLEVALAGAKGWISGYPQVFPESCTTLYQAALAGDLETALPLYRQLHPVLRWDSNTNFIQAIKLSAGMVGPDEGPSRPPLLPLSASDEATLRAAMKACIAAGMK
ncbi:dihydrodipicolinate synthase family protein [Streptomyces arenae]|uniref:dihydrodipicolinate synthase family protein n=1 Tax=Streptomyces arenae TaxID=29301 RepID=UPI00265818BC|nr:dihydrodipicolinate synthase family protein [Streptomyces arenae]MCG7207445.1 dihydrodipicolinate synthase family protein [Streptomyces arenae]